MQLGLTLTFNEQDSLSTFPDCLYEKHSVKFGSAEQAGLLHLRSCIKDKLFPSTGAPIRITLVMLGLRWTVGMQQSSSTDSHRYTSSGNEKSPVSAVLIGT